MKLRITNDSVGRYNLISNENTYEFFMCIYDNDNNIVTDGVNKARIHFSGEPERKDDFQGAIDNMEYVIGECIKYCGRIWSTTDYIGDALYFANVYMQNYEQLNETYKAEKAIALQKQIDELQQKLTYMPDIDDIHYEVKSYLNERITIHKKWIADVDVKIADAKEGSQTHIDLITKRQDYVLKIEKFQAQINALSDASQRINDVE